MIVGAGPVGLVVAQQASEQGWSCLVVEKREHIGGNCYDSLHPSGVMIHNYGPHYFRTDSDPVFEYLSRFTAWIDGNYIVKSEVDGQRLPFPINLDTLEVFFGRKLDAGEAKELLEAERDEIPSPANSEEFVRARVGQRLFDAFYRDYTRKMWAREARDLDPSVCGRIPVKLDRDPYYVQAKYRRFPRDGYTAMFRRMVEDPLITLRTGVNYFDERAHLSARIATVYTGPIDRYFDHCHGPLEWRSLQFDFKEEDREFVQECVQINFPDLRPETRSVEIKHVTGQAHPKTVVCTEVPTAKGDPYYPVPDPANRARYERYRAMADQERKERGVHFAGRLAEYTYMNMDEAVARGLELAQMLVQGQNS